MSAHFAKDGMGFAIPAMERAERERTQRSGLFARVAAAAQWMAQFPRRQAVIEQLSMLSDHELADIGLTRAELPMVFDSHFRAARRAG
jgi:uncharacterized protein YjiS (DUF1127 family)